MNRIGILTTDTDLVVTTWDAALESMTGISADRARGRRLDEVVPDLRKRALMDLIREPLASGSAQHLLRGGRPPGSSRLSKGWKTISTNLMLDLRRMICHRWRSWLPMISEGSIPAFPNK